MDDPYTNDLIQKYGEEMFHTFMEWVRTVCQDEIEFKLQDIGIVTYQELTQFDKSLKKKGKMFKNAFPFVRDYNSVLEDLLHINRYDLP